MGKLLLLIPLTLLLVCVALLAESWVKLYALSTVPVTALTMAQGFHILLLALGIGVLVMLMLVFLFLILELGLKKEGGGGLVCLGV
jgi:hypothetical protein